MGDCYDVQALNPLLDTSHAWLMMDVLKVPLSHPTIIFESLYISRSCVPFSYAMSSSVLAAYSSSLLLVVSPMPSLKNDFVTFGKRSHLPVLLIPGLSMDAPSKNPWVMFGSGVFWIRVHGGIRGGMECFPSFLHSICRIPNRGLYFYIQN